MKWQRHRESWLVICCVLGLCLTSTACSLTQPCLCRVNHCAGKYLAALGAHVKKVRGTRCTERLLFGGDCQVLLLGEENGLPKCALINNLTTHKPRIDSDAKTNSNLLAPSLHLWIPSDSWDCFCSVWCWGGGGSWASCSLFVCCLLTKAAQPCYCCLPATSISLLGSWAFFGHVC